MTTTDIAVRIAKAADEDALVEAVRVMHSDNEWGLRQADGRPLAFSERSVRQTIRRAIIADDNTADHAWIGVLGPVDSPAVWGSIHLWIGSPFCSEEQVIYEGWNFVLPEFRTAAHGARHLIHFATAMAAIWQLPLIIGIMSHVRTEAKRRLYQRALGTQESGAVFLYHAANDADFQDFSVPAIARGA